MSTCEEFFLLVLEAHICAAAMEVFGMSSLDDEPSPSNYFPEGSALLTPTQRWEIMSVAIEDIISKFVDISYPTTSPKDHDHVHAYAKELMSLGLILMEFIDGVREGGGKRIIRCWQYYLPLFKACG